MEGVSKKKEALSDSWSATVISEVEGVELPFCNLVASSFPFWAFLMKRTAYTCGKENLKRAVHKLHHNIIHECNTNISTRNKNN
jgi:hypothetical protein